MGFFDDPYENRAPGPRTGASYIAEYQRRIMDNQRREAARRDYEAARRDYEAKRRVWEGRVGMPPPHQPMAVGGASAPHMRNPQNLRAFRHPENGTWKFYVHGYHNVIIDMWGLAKVHPNDIPATISNMLKSEWGLWQDFPSASDVIRATTRMADGKQTPPPYGLPPIDNEAPFTKAARFDAAALGNVGVDGARIFTDPSPRAWLNRRIKEVTDRAK